ncbi:MFS transporter [Streptomyces iconiensis]|uniref:MFS transporter n=1 Tax=Streptomyces iconiensis TaxID=1384038 RepID=A0ABT7A5B9_9ACTN|nr:MFS transporter [Streptomyces iconiensis]MDJ1136550.1 MFS transporter [Streptomyces iconiensis]
MKAGTKPLSDPAGKRVLSAATLASAPSEVLDFLLPLWAGSSLGASATVIGALIAVESVLSLVVRPLAGRASDRFDPRHVAAAGAVLYAASFAGYALATGYPVAFAAAALGGCGGALFWVGLRTWVGSRTASEGDGLRSSGYGKLLTAEGEGAFVGYLVAFALLDQGGYVLLFWVGAAACATAAVLLGLHGERTRARQGPEAGPGAEAGTEPGAEPGTGADTEPGAGPDAEAKPEVDAGPWPLDRRRLRPLMGVSALTAAAEAGVWMLLLLRLQEDLGMEPVEIAMVFAPGFIVFILVPEHAHHVTERLGRTRTMVLAFTAAALFAGGLAVAATPVVIACLWALAAACYAAQIPVEQATIAAASGGSVGRGMGLYESARLVGVMAGPLLMGGLYQAVGWAAACGLAAVLSLAGALAVPRALRATGLPEPAGTPPVEAPHEAPAGARTAGTRPAGTEAPASPPQEPDTVPDTNEEKETRVDLSKRKAEEGLSAEERARRERQGWYIHTVAFLIAQAALYFFEQNWVYWKLTEGDVPEEHTGWATTAGRIWLIIWVIDALVSWSYTIWPRAKKPS